MSTHVFFAELQTWLAQPPLVPDPPPAAPGGKLTAATNTILSWMKWGGLVGAVGAGIASGIMMAIGRRNRNNMAVEGAISLPWIFGGVALIMGSASVVGFFV